MRRSLSGLVGLLVVLLLVLGLSYTAGAYCSSPCNYTCPCEYYERCVWDDSRCPASFCYDQGCVGFCLHCNYQYVLVSYCDGSSESYCSLSCYQIGCSQCPQCW